MASLRPSLFAVALSLGLAGCNGSHPPPVTMCTGAQCSPGDPDRDGLHRQERLLRRALSRRTRARAPPASTTSPTPATTTWCSSILAILQGDAGSSPTPAFGLTSGVFFQLSAMPTGTVNLPTVDGERRPELVRRAARHRSRLARLPPALPALGRLPRRRRPLRRPRRSSSLLPLQGVPLRPRPATPPW